MRLKLFLLISLLALPQLAPVGQMAPADVAPEQDSYAIAPGGATAIMIRLENATNVYGVDVRASFDPALVEVVDADATADGIQVEPGRFPHPDFVAVNRVYSQAGTIRYVLTQVNPTPPANGGGVLFTVRLRGLGVAGIGELRIDQVEMSDRNGQLLPVQWQSAALEVQGSPVTDQEAEPTGVAIVPTSPPSAAATPTTLGNMTPLAATDPPPTITSEPLGLATEPPPELVTVPAAVIAITATVPSSAVTDNGESEIVKGATNLNTTSAITLEGTDESGAALPQDSTDVAPEVAASAEAVAGRNEMGLTSTVTTIPESEFAVIGNDQAVADSERPVALDASSGNSISFWMLLIAVGLVAFVTIGVVVMARRSG